MATRPHPTAPEDWLQHAAWLHRLAQRLVADPHAADDLVQETWFASLSSAPSGARLKPWLARVLRNFARQHGRKQSIRAHHEVRSGARGEAASASDVVGRLETQRLLVEALLRLEEPYRATIVRRYFDGASAADIAREHGLPDATVRWRLMRGLELLRAELDRKSGGDRQAWMLALVPLCQSGGAIPSTANPTADVARMSVTAGAIVMKAGTKLVLAAGLLVTLLLGIWWMLAGPQQQADVREEPAFASSAAIDADAPVADEQDRAPRELLATESSAPPAAAALAVARVECRIVDDQRRPLADASLRAADWSGAAPATSAADGRIVLELPARGDVNESQRDWADFQVVHAAHATRHLGARVSFERTTYLGTLELVPGGSVSGSVVDERGAPLADAHVFAQVLGEPFVSSLLTGPQQQRPDSSYLCSLVDARIARARTGVDGSFNIERLPAGQVRIWAARPLLFANYSGLLDVRAGTNVACDPLVLAEQPHSEAIRGRVLDPEGQALPGIALTLEAYEYNPQFQVMTDADGRFVLPAPAGSAHGVLGMDPRRRWADLRAVVESPANDAELRFAQFKRLTIRVLDADSAPLKAFGVVVCAPNNGPEIFVHPCAPRPAGELDVQLPDTKYRLIVHAPGHASPRTDDLDPETTPPTLEFKLERPPGIRGRVLDQGKPVEGARVQLARMLAKGWCKEIRDIGAVGSPLLSFVFSPDSSEKVTTDATGEFALKLLPGEPNLLRVEKRGRAPVLRWSLTDPIDGLEIELGPGGSIEGNVALAEGEDRSGILIGATCGDGLLVTRRTDPTGHYRFDALNPGAWQVRVLERERTPREERTTLMEGGFKLDQPPFDCTVVAGEVARVDFRAQDLVRPRLRGCLVVDGRAPRDWSAMLTKTRVGGMPLRTSRPLGADGCFEISVAEGGEWELRVAHTQSTGPGLQLFDRWNATTARSDWSCELQTAVVRGKPGLKVSAREMYCAVTELADGRSCVALFQPGSDQLWPTTVAAGTVRIIRRPQTSMYTDPREGTTLATIQVRPGETVEFDLP